MPFLRRRQEDESEVAAAAPPPSEPPPAEPLPAETPPAEASPLEAPLADAPLLGPEIQAEPTVESQFQPVDGADEMLDMPLGTLIFRAGLIAPQQLEDALAEGLRSGKRLGEVLLARGWLSEEDLSRLLAGQKGLPYADVDRVAVDYELARVMSYEDAQRELALPLVNEFGAPVVAMCDPDEGAMERLRAQIGPDTKFVVAAPSALTRLIDEVLGAAGAPASPLLAAPGGEQAPLEATPEEAASVTTAEAAPAATPAAEEPGQPEEIVPIIGEGEVDYPTFTSSYETIPVPETLGAPAEQLPVDAQMSEYGYFGDSSLLEGSAWQPGEPGPVSDDEAAEVAPPAAEEHAGYDVGYESEPPPEAEPAVSEDTEAEPREADQELGSEQLPASVEEAPQEQPEEAPQEQPEEAPQEQPEEAPQEQPEEAVVEESIGETPVLTPAWMRGEVNVITADVADFIDSGPSAEADTTAPPALEDQEYDSAPAGLEPGADGGEAAEPVPAAEELGGESYEVAEPLESEPTGEDLVAEPTAETPEPDVSAQGDEARGEYELVLRLSDGDHVPIGTFTSLEEAQAQAGDVVKQFTDVKEGSWPFIGGRYLRPETIVSIDIEHHETGWGGSGNRGRMFSGDGT